MALFRLDERAKAFFTASIVNVLLTIALTLWLVVGRTRAHAPAAGELRRLGGGAGRPLLGAAPPAAGRRDPAAALRPMLRFGLPTMPAELSLYALNFVDRVVLARVSGLPRRASTPWRSSSARW